MRNTKKLYMPFLFLLCTHIALMAQNVKDAARATEVEHYKQAGAMLNTILKNNPDDITAWYTLGNLYEQIWVHDYQVIGGAVIMQTDMLDSAKFCFKKAYGV